MAVAIQFAGDLGLTCVTRPTVVAIASTIVPGKVADGTTIPIAVLVARDLDIAPWSSPTVFAGARTIVSWDSANGLAMTRTVPWWTRDLVLACIATPTMLARASAIVACHKPRCVAVAAARL